MRRSCWPSSRCCGWRFGGKPRRNWGTPAGHHRFAIGPAVGMGAAPRVGPYPPPRSGRQLLPTTRNDPALREPGRLDRQPRNQTPTRIRLRRHGIGPGAGHAVGNRAKHSWWTDRPNTPTSSRNTRINFRRVPLAARPPVPNGERPLFALPISNQNPQVARTHQSDAVGETGDRSTILDRPMAFRKRR
jgi:hypothetical protein